MDQRKEDQNNSIEKEDSLLTQFINITGAEESIAKNTLEASNWNLEFAINMFVDSNLAQQHHHSHQQPNQTSTSTNQPSLASTSTDLPKNNQSNAPSIVNDTEQVRPPIAPIRQVLVEDYPRSFINSSFDAFRNFQQESRWQEQQLNEQNEGTQSDSSNNSSNNRPKSYDDLFRPPLDLMFRGSFEMAKFEGQRQNKWLLVNVQNTQEFSCLELNRDVWSHPTVKEIIKEHFIFWQTYHDSVQGQNFISFYNVHSYPYISIIDPRTGEKIFYWHYELDIFTFCERVAQFLSEHPSPSGKSSDNSTSSSSNSNNKNTNESDKTTLYDDNEQKQIEAAIKASLEGIVDENSENSKNEDQNSSTNTTSSTTKNEQLPKENWKDYLGTDGSNRMELVIRFPDGNKEKVMFPSDSKLKALILYVSEHGYNMENYDLITNFPKKNLSSCDQNATLLNVGIHSRDTLYVQIKN